MYVHRPLKNSESQTSVRIWAIKDHERHYYPHHPECPERITWIIERVGVDKWFSGEDEEIVLSVHACSYVEKIKSVKRTTFLDPDTYVTPWTYRVALRAITASYYAPEGTFILTRPPGHHAGRDYGMGFCIFNNAIAAALSFLDKGERVGILDLDAHHGNGTEELARRLSIPYASVHMAYGFPGTGYSSGDLVLNIPLEEPVAWREYESSLRKCLRFLREHSDVLVVSLGFDTLAEDLLTYFALSVLDFKRIGKLLSDWDLKVVLEGGYSPAVGEAVELFLAGLEG